MACPEPVGIRMQTASGVASVFVCGILLSSCQMLYRDPPAQPYGGPLMVPVDSSTFGPPSECVVVTPVESEIPAGQPSRARAETEATNWLRGAAAEIGANYVRVDSFDIKSGGKRHGWRGSVHGVAYRCGESQAPTEVVCNHDEGLCTCTPVFRASR